MLSKTNLISTLITGIWSFFGGYLLWGLLVDPYLMDHILTAGVAKEMPEFGPLALGCLLSAFAFSTIYSKWSRGIHNTAQGATYGLWVGILIGFGSGLINYATANMLDLSGTLVNGLTYVVFFIVMGILASLIYGKAKSEE